MQIEREVLNFLPFRDSAECKMGNGRLHNSPSQPLNSTLDSMYNIHCIYTQWRQVYIYILFSTLRFSVAQLNTGLHVYCVYILCATAQLSSTLDSIYMYFSPLSVFQKHYLTKLCILSLNIQSDIPGSCQGC